MKAGEMQGKDHFANQMEDHTIIETEVEMTSMMLVIVMKNKIILLGRENLHQFRLDHERGTEDDQPPLII